MLMSTIDNGGVVCNFVFGRHVLWNWIPYGHRPTGKAGDYAIRKYHPVPVTAWDVLSLEARLCIYHYAHTSG